MMHTKSSGKQSISLLSCALWLACGSVVGCGHTGRPVDEVQQAPPSTKVQETITAPKVTPNRTEPVLLEPSAKKTAVDEPIKPASTKVAVRSADSDIESVTIDGREYSLPTQWQGRKVDYEPFPLTDLVQIPPDFCENGASIYLRKEAVAALVAMAERALDDNVSLLVNSGFRSTRYQRVIFKRMMQHGRTFDDIVRYVAPPGYSEHILGTAVDFAPGNWRFADTPEYRWLKDNAAAFGFSESYPEDNPENLPWESWHWKWSAPVELNY